MNVTLGPIVVGHDFSTNARSALRWATGFARRQNAAIRLVHVLDDHALPRGIRERLAIDESIDRALAESEDEVAREGVPIEVCRTNGRPWEALNVEAVSAEARLIVVGRRGHNPLERLLVGSTTDRLIRTARRPVVAVPQFEGAHDGNIRQVLLATDFSPQSHQALAELMNLIHADSGPVHLTLVHCCEPPVAFGGPEMPAIVLADWDVLVDDARKNLAEMARKLTSERVTVESIVERGQPEEAILSVAQRQKPSLIVMGTHGRSALGDFFLGGVAVNLVHHAHGAVMTVRH